ncbi:MAG: shikimate kinase [Acidimicrobiales bacterium]
MPDGAPRPGAHVVLVGLMGAGKTTVGRKVARLLGRAFVDADEELEARSGRTVATWFAEDGEAGFRGAERDLLADLLAGTEPIVVGAGGGVVVTEANRERLRADDVAVVYLHGEPAFLASRVQAKPHRPLLDDDPAAVLGAMYHQRDGWYRAVADAVVEVRPAHEAGPKPKWRLADQVVDAIEALGVASRVEEVPT